MFEPESSASTRGWDNSPWCTILIGNKEKTSEEKTEECQIPHHHKKMYVLNVNHTFLLSKLFFFKPNQTRTETGHQKAESESIKFKRYPTLACNSTTRGIWHIMRHVSSQSCIGVFPLTWPALDLGDMPNWEWGGEIDALEVSDRERGRVGR